MNESISNENTEIRPGGSTTGYDLPPGSLLGDYRIIRTLGRGGMGQVYLAENRVSGKKIALKLLPAQTMLGAGFLDRFRIESRVMSDLHHPNIVQVHHAGEDQGRYYLTMDYIEGPDGEAKTLEDRLKVEGSRLKEEEIKTIALQLLDALIYAHGQGIIHRDLKPANILLETKHEAPGTKHATVKVADFGLAKVVGDDFVTAMVKKSVSLSMGRSIGEAATQQPRYEGTSTGAMLGTYDYMSPEQKAGAAVTEQSDLYAFGVILYRMLTGRKPEGRFKLPSAFGFNPAWDAIVDKCLEPDFQDRYATAAAVKADVEGVGKEKLRNTRKTRKGGGWLAVAGVLAMAGMGWFLLSRDAGSDDARMTAVPQREVEDQRSPTPETTVLANDSKPADTEVVLRVEPAGAALAIFNDRGGLVLKTNSHVDGVTVRLPPGSYEVEGERSGYQMMSERFVVADKQVMLERVMTALRGSLSVVTVPGARIAARDDAGHEEDLGTADATGRFSHSRLVEGNYDIIAMHPDYFGRTNRATIRRDRPDERDLRLSGRPGSVYIGASPQADVWVDGVLRGKTGTVITNLQPGARSFEVRLTGHQTMRFDLEIPPNRSAPRKNLGNLSRESGAIRIQFTVEPASASAHFQSLEKQWRVGSNPWKTFTGLTNVWGGLSCETQKVEVAVAGYDITRGLPARPVVQDGQTTTVTVAVSPKPSKITITSNARDAEVFDATGTILGTVGKELTLASFVTHVLTVQARGYADGTTSFVLNQPDTTFTAREVLLEEQRGPMAGQNWTSPSTGMEFVWIDALKIWVGKYEVTNGEYRKKERGHDSKSFERHSLNGDRQPVVYVNFDDAKKYAEWLTAQDRASLSGAKYRLPSDQEFLTYAQCGRGWEYPWGNNWPPVSGQAGNYHGQEGAGSWNKISGYRDGHPVSCDVEKSWANPWGLYGVGGNVWEACASDASGNSFGAWRGASWNIDPQGHLRCSLRVVSDGSNRDDYSGFRLVLFR